MECEIENGSFYIGQKVPQNTIAIPIIESTTVLSDIRTGTNCIVSENLYYLLLCIVFHLIFLSKFLRLGRRHDLAINK